MRDELYEMVGLVQLVHGELSETGLRADRDGGDPGEGLELLAKIGDNRLHVPVAHGGLEEPAAFGAWPTVIETIAEIAAGDGATGQNWLATWLVARMIFTSDLPQDTMTELAHELLHNGLRLVSSAAETGVADGPVTARDVEVASLSAVPRVSTATAAIPRGRSCMCTALGTACRVTAPHWFRCPDPASCCTTTGM